MYLITLAACTAVQFMVLICTEICWHLSSRPRLWPLISRMRAQPPWPPRPPGTYRRLSRPRAAVPSIGERGGTLWASGEGRHPCFESPVLKQFFLKIVGSMLFILSLFKKPGKEGLLLCS